VFLPMTLLMMASSILAGRWTVLVGPRWSITIGCQLFATGMFLVNGYLNSRPDYGPVITGLGLAGIGIGTSVVPVTSAVLAAVPPERSTALPAVRRAVTFRDDLFGRRPTRPGDAGKARSRQAWTCKTSQFSQAPDVATIPGFDASLFPQLRGPRRQGLPVS
jgi:xanthosine utilization system XapX-like protein